MKKPIFLLLSLFFLTACLQSPPRTAAEVEQESHCQEDKYADTKFCFSPEYSDGLVSAYLGINGNWSSAEAYLIGEYHANNWLFLESAKDSSGKNMKFRQKNRDVSVHSAMITETFFLDAVDTAYLKKHKDIGLDIKLYGDRGNAILKLPPEYIQGFLNFMKHNGLQKKGA